MASHNPEIARETVFEIIKNQMRDGTPPETKHTYERLIADGFSDEETMKFIGCALSSEMFELLKHNLTYDEERYVSALKTLPELPWDNDEDRTT